MSATLKIVYPGALATLQDYGRYGYRRFGVPRSGALHTDLARIANNLVTNRDEAAVIEFFLSGPTLKVLEGSVQLALAGAFSSRLIRARRTSPIKAWRTITLHAGDTLEVGTVEAGKVGYIAVAGEFDLPEVMGSTSTYLRGGFGGIDGDRLQAGAKLKVAKTLSRQADEQCLPDFDHQLIGLSTEQSDQPVEIRVVLGPQQDYFSPAAIDQFLGGNYTITPESDRMGSRLDGPVLKHAADKPPEIISDGIVPGAIQVPGNGSPIVLLMDGPTVGGYPKIATVTSIDVSKLAVMLPGTKIRFVAVDPEDAEDLLYQHTTAINTLIDSVMPLTQLLEEQSHKMHIINLISGAIDIYGEDK